MLRDWGMPARIEASGECLDLSESGVEGPVESAGEERSAW